MPLQPISIQPENSLGIIRGTSRTLQLTITDATGKPVDLTGAKIVMTVKVLATDINPLIQKTTDTSSQALITVPREGKAEIYLIPADTQTLTIKQYTYDIWLILLSGKRLVVVQPSVFDVQAGVTLLAL